MTTSSAVFTPAELAYLQGQRLARLATIGPDGAPQVRPVGFRVDPDAGVIEVAGLDNPSTQKWRNVLRDGRVSILVDDLETTHPWRPRALEIRGVAEALADVLPAHPLPGMRPGVIRIRPRRVISLGIEGTRGSAPRDVPQDRVTTGG